MPRRIAVIVQARMGSTRFPGKTLAPFGQTTVLAHILRRLRPGRHPVDLWVATSTDAADDAIAEACEHESVPVARGPDADVLRRVAGALEQMHSPPAAVVRMCADRPFVDASLVDELIDTWAATGEPDYLANNLQPSFPYGLDLEIVKTSALLEADAEAVDDYEREHVSPFVYRRPERFRLVGYPCPFGNFSRARVVVDTHEDHAAMETVERRLRGLDPGYGYRDLLNLYAVEPALFATSA